MGLYALDKVRMNDIMDQGADENGSFWQEKVNAIWFAKALQFQRFDDNVANNESKESKKPLLLKKDDCNNEYCFVHYYDVLPQKIVFLDKSDKILACVRLMWDRET